MTKGLRGAALLAPVAAAALLLFGAPSATFAASHQDDPPRGAHSAHSGDPNAGGAKAGSDKAGGDKAGGDKAGGDQPGSAHSGDPNAGSDKAGSDKAGGDQPGSAHSGDPKAGGDKAGSDKPGGDKPGGDKPSGDRPGRDAGAHGGHDGWYGHYDHDHFGYHGHHDWDTHRRYYRYGYAGPGWYDDCGYYGPDGYDGYYDSPDACDWQYGPQGQSLRANLSGDQEVPGPGAPNSFGTANIFADPANGRLCYRLGYDGINRPSMAHIHRGGPGQTGQPVIDLGIAANGDEGCVGADPAVLHSIADHPEAFYLNLHTPEYPDGAMRGQLFDTGRR